MKTSFYLVLIQLINLVVGLFTVYLVAKNVEPKLYAIVGINAIICTFISVFSYFGFEAHVSRKGLAWIDNGQNKKLRFYISNAIYSRVTISVIISPLLLLYSYYLSVEKFSGEFFPYFIIFCISGIFYSFNNGCVLIKKGMNQFISAAVIVFISSTLGKLLAIWSFFHFGFTTFILMISFTPIIISFYFMFWIRKYFYSSYIKIEFYKYYKQNRYFTFRGYVSYLKQHADQLLFSMLLAPALFATYNLMKRLEDIIRVVIENIFDPACQSLISHRGNSEYIIKRIKSINRIKNLLMVISVILSTLTMYNVDSIIMMAGLEKYKHLDLAIFTIIIGQFIYLSSKIKVNILTLFYPPIEGLKCDSYSAFFSIMALIFAFMFLNSEAALMSRIVIYSSIFIFCSVKVNEKNLNSNV
ncbi:hypothetical protein L4C54_18050 [Vibrio lamellibrachiae]|uniref:hypothetical protein n=1 Tax=Vibrio lamellibrachiae TaxID=2910253 RepID=UPI003D10BD98